MRNFVRKALRGLNLAEVLIAVTIFCAVGIALMEVWGTHYRAVGKNQNYVVASTVAELVMESQLSLGWTVDNVTEQEFDVGYIVNGSKQEAQFFYKVEAADVNTDPATVGMKSVIVTVRWKEGDQDRRVVLNTMLAWDG